MLVGLLPIPRHLCSFWPASLRFVLLQVRAALRAGHCPRRIRALPRDARRRLEAAEEAAAAGAARKAAAEQEVAELRAEVRGGGCHTAVYILCWTVTGVLLCVVA